jgi:DNA polymerase-3 subunit beta
MKFSARATDLAAALAFARRGVAAKSMADVPRTLLLRTADDGVEIVAHRIDRCHIARCAATVQTPGVIAVPADRLVPLIDATPPDAMVTISYTDTTATVAMGRSRYRLPAMHASDFPTVLAAAANAVTIDLTGADSAALLGGLAKLVSDDEHRPYLTGIYLHATDGRLAAAVTDGLVFLRRMSTLQVKALPGIIVPPATAEEIDRFSHCSSITLAIDGRLLEARIDGSRFTIVSKLIDATFPDYARLMPPLAAATAEFAAADMLAALGRLVAASSRERPAVGMTWSGGDGLSLCLVDEDGIASDTIAAKTTGGGRAACLTVQLRKVVEAMDAPFCGFRSMVRRQRYRASMRRKMSARWQ